MGFLSTLTEALNSFSYIPLTALAYFGYVLSLVIYRLYFSPIAKFPGPKLAAVTYWYETYYDLVLRGQYMNKLRELHKEYGPIIRVNPEELHVSDSTFYGPLYAPSAPPSSPTKAPKRNKSHRFCRGLGFPESSLFNTPSHDHHRMRRKPLEPFFSPASVRKLQDLITEKIDLLCKRIREEGKDGKPVPLKRAFSAFATDVVSDYCLGRSHDNLSDPAFSLEYQEVLDDLGTTAWVLKPFPLIAYVIEYMPKWAVSRMHPGIQAAYTERETTMQLLKELKANRAKGLENKSHPTVLSELLDSDLPAHEKTDFRLQAEIEITIGAGTITTGETLGIITIYLLNDPETLAKLKKELNEAIPNPDSLPPLQVLEKLPYLTGVIREGLRLGFGVASRLPRCPDAPLQFNQWTIPAGTPVSMSSAFVNLDPAIWEEPRKFVPERWLDPAESARLYKYMVSFSKGSRMCIGINLAYAELYMTVAAVFSRFDLQKCNFTVDDVQLKADFFTPRFNRNPREMTVCIA